MTTKTRIAPSRAGRPVHNKEQSKPTTCALCATTEALYIVGESLQCVGCIALAVSVAANDLWPNLVRYSHEFETTVLM